MEVLSEVATAVADRDVTGKRLRLKILVKKPTIEACKPSQIPEVNSLKKPQTISSMRKDVSGEKKLNSTLGAKHVTGACQFPKQVSKMNCFQKSSVTDVQMTTVFVNKKFNSVAGFKRKSDDVLKSHDPKRLKMDHYAISHCWAVLEKLMHHKLSLPFLAPVNPKAWDIDDYFDVIEKPMDLGTIKEKLQQHKYIGLEQFEADVRLTFSNAMVYNPPVNWVHKYAKELMKVFDNFWKPVKMKMLGEQKDVKQRGSERSPDETTSDVKDNCLLRRETVQVLSTTVIHPQGKGLLSTTSNLDHLPAKAMLQTKRDLGDLKKTSVDGQYRDLKALNNGKPKDSLSSKIHSDCKPKDSLSSKARSDFSGPDSRLHKSVSPMSVKVKFENAPAKKTAHDNINAIMNVEHSYADSPPTIGSIGATGFETVSDVELSPSKALRVAKLKSRFAETILKAQRHTLLEPGGETSKTVWQQEKELMQKRQQEEKARIEAQIKAAKSAARLKEESELRRQRQEAREAFRMSIRKMEQSVHIDDNLQVLKDLEVLTGNSLVVVCHDRRSRASVWSHHVEPEKLRSPLERLGLYIKEEYRAGDYDDDVYSVLEGGQEGEFIC